MHALAATSGTFSSTLAVTGNTTVGGTLGVTSNATVGGTLGVTGATTLASLGVTGNATAGGTLGVTGNATVGGTLGVTGALTATAGIVGTTTNNNANSGSVGEYTTNAGDPATPSTGVPYNGASMLLTAGDWDVWTVGNFVSGSGVTCTQQTLGASTTSATLGDFGSYATYLFSVGAGNSVVLFSPVARFSLASSTTVYAVSLAGFSGGTESTQQTIYARRVR